MIPFRTKATYLSYAVKSSRSIEQTHEKFARLFIKEGNELKIKFASYTIINIIKLKIWEKNPGMELQIEAKTDTRVHLK